MTTHASPADARAGVTSGAEVAVAEVAAAFEPLRSTKAADVAARRIVQRIVDDEMPPGSRLPTEPEMQQSLRVSRGTVREALRILEGSGIVQVKTGPRGGPIVREVSSLDVAHAWTLYLQRMRVSFREIWDAHAELEPLMVRLAAQQLTTETAERIEQSVKAHWDSLDSAATTWSVTACGFHGIINSSSASRVLNLAARALLAVEYESLGLLPSLRATREATAHAHQGIAVAILARDGDAAERAARTHLAELAERLFSDYANASRRPISWV